MDAIQTDATTSELRPGCCGSLTHPRDWRIWIAVKWAFGKLSEIPQLRSADFIMARTETFASQHKQAETIRVLSVGEIAMLHPINRKSAEDKTETRRQAAKEAHDVLENSGWILSEELIASHTVLAPFKSITGICVVRSGPLYYALEGNGRLMALRDVYPQLKVEVREYIYSDSDHEKLIELVKRTRSANGIDKVAQATLPSSQLRA